MFKVDDHEVRFSYEYFEDGYIRTQCGISYQNEKSVGEIYGHARKSPSDQFDRNRGRKLALSRVLNRLTDDKNYRKKFWDAYFAARHGKY